MTPRCGAGRPTVALARSLRRGDAMTTGRTVRSWGALVALAVGAPACGDGLNAPPVVSDGAFDAPSSEMDGPSIVDGIPAAADPCSIPADREDIGLVYRDRNGQLAAITDEGSIDLVVPDQGGFVLLIGPRLRGVGECTVVINAAVFDPCNGRALA